MSQAKRILRIVPPSKRWEEELHAYRDEMFANGETILNGCGGLERYDQFQDWLDHLHSYANRETIDPSTKYVEGSQWLLVDEKETRVYGMMNLRHYLNEQLLKTSGHIGYSIRPSERKKGYGMIQLQLGLQKLAEFGVKKALVTCDDNNLASAKTIESCGGILENSIFDPVEKRLTRRYWIEIK